jgi:mannose-6-phosphate isomerase-like protein (cupin superfamily)
MKPEVKRYNTSKEYFFAEGCHINELSNSTEDADVSIARARVEPGQTTRWHYLEDIAERYVLLEGSGLVEVEGLPAHIPALQVTAGDVVVIPPGARQRIQNTGDDDLVFLAICTPRFTADAYVDAEDESAL